MKRLLIPAAVTVAALLALSPALGQTSALKGHDGNAPIDFAADRIEVQDRADRAIISGNVVATQAELILRAARITVLYANTGGIDIQRIDASGGVSITSPSETARGDFGIYDLNARLITLIGGVTLIRGENEVKGGRLVLDLETGRAVMDGAGPAGTRSEGGRVTGTFTVPQRN